MNWIDLLIVTALGAALFTGYRRGALLQFFSWGGFVVGLFVGGLFAPLVVGLFNPQSAVGQAGIAIGVFLGTAFLVEAGMAVLGHRVRKRLPGARAHQIDAIAGSVVAGMLALVAAWFLGITLKRGPSPELSAAIKGSAIMRFTDRIAPRPPGLFAGIGQFLSKSGFPEVFAKLNPSLAPGVEPPPPELARDREVLGAARVTYKIESEGCGGFVDGSGFPVGDGLMFTAAHVVAGTGNTRVIPADDDQRYSARVIYMDDEKDIALLRVSRLPAGSLDVSREEAARGTDGAAIGYPGGGPRRISVARVRARTEAVGRDIYSRRLVEREIYVLRATVRQGNSGGPLVDTDGVVRGMVFAAASDDDTESYALAESELRRALARARDRTQPVDTGDCAV